MHICVGGALHVCVEWMMMRRGNVIEQGDIHRRLEHDNNNHSWVAPTCSTIYPFLSFMLLLLFTSLLNLVLGKRICEYRVSQDKYCVDGLEGKGWGNLLRIIKWICWLGMIHHLEGDLMKANPNGNWIEMVIKERRIKDMDKS
jgi:hypothetical protein